jgi:hypothetical protein
MKVCTKCKVEKDFIFFYPRRERGLNEYRSKCKECCSIEQKERKDKNKEYAKKNYLKHIEKRKKESRDYRLKNLEKVKTTEQKSRQKHKEKRIKYSIDYHKKRRKTDILFKLRHRISSLINSKIKFFGYTKKSKCYDILGCDFLFFKEHIESKFTNGMNWDNYGEWHLDHIKPISLAKTEEDIIKLNCYTNFQPLWAIDNLKKSNKYEK